MSSIYISGPMRGYKHFNFPAFWECEQYLRDVQFCGVESKQRIFNPARHDAEVLGFGWEPDETIEISEADMHNWMRTDLTEVAAAQHIVLLPGWRESTGARREYAVARWCGLTAWEYDPDATWNFRLMRVFGDVDAESVVAMSGGVDKSATVTDVIERTDLAQQEFDGYFAATISGPEPRPVALEDPWAELIAEEEQKILADLERPIWGDTASEVRSVNPITGGEKGVKPARFDLLPVGPLTAVATHYGIGAQKYEDRNWERGYEWSKSYAALQRHANAFWGGEDIDPETGSPHMAAVVFHALALLEFGSTHPELDDRPRVWTESGWVLH